MGAHQFGDCRVLEELGSGAISTVYKAIQEPLERTVAVKALKSTIATSSTFAAHLEREARVLSDLSHPNVALLFAFVKTEAQMYLVLEYVDGYSLAAVLAKKPRQRPEVAAAIGAEIARGLAHAHERGVVHRDVKPSNVLLSKRGDLKLVDFGIAQRERMPSLDEPLSKVEDATAFGTPAYMSPEQILGEFVDARSDMFSLGVVLYQMLAGARPWGGEDASDRRTPAQRIRRDPPKPLRSRRVDVPRSLERIIMRLLEKLPADRYASASTVADELDEFVRASGSTPGRRLVARALVEAGLAKASAASSGGFDGAAEPPRPPLKPTLIGFAVLSAMVIGGGATIQLWSQGAHKSAPSGEQALELAPADAAYLRVVATPWAEVSVDGQRVDVTPFARAIPLPAGTHYVTLSHPDAPPEKRVVQLGAGETKLLDVTMSVRGEADAAPSPAPPTTKAPTAKGDSAPRGPR
jgi:hypothetical protein